MSGAAPQGLTRTANATIWPPVTTRRRVGNWVFWALCLIALALVITPTLWMIIGIIARAASNFKISVLWTDTTTTLSGGLLQPILGTILITLCAAVVGGAVSILTGMYLSEFSRRRGERSFLRGGYEVLAGIPSIVLGYVGYVALVVGLHWGFGLLPAVLVMTVLVIPYITKATETSLAQVPTGYREGAEALGMSTSYTMRRIVLKSAVPGIITGALVAIAIAIGETAPLIYTANFTELQPSLTHVTHQAVPFLTYPVYFFSYLVEPQKSANILANDAALILMAMVLVLIIIGRFIAARARRHAE
jgi:phosphate transport system permease protein